MSRLTKSTRPNSLERQSSPSRSAKLTSLRRSRTEQPHRHHEPSNQAQLQLLRTLQAKLTMSTPGDKYEQEADRVADQVMRMPEPGKGSPQIQRACADCEEELQAKPLAGEISPLVQRQMEPEEEEEETVQASHLASQNVPEIADLENDVKALQHGGRPLSPGERDFFEPRFGINFGHVRVHDGPQAHRTAASINAAAFTTKNHVFLGQSQYQPHTANGRHLMAHELTHVVQQSHSSGAKTPGVQRRPARVTLSHTSRCTNPRAIAEAIPGAKAMTWTALTWFLSFSPTNRARVDELLRANFLSDSQSVFDTVKDRIVSTYNYLQAAQSGNITFDCVPATDPDCENRSGYVRTNDRSNIYLCPAFFNMTLEERRWMLIHECAHLAGAIGNETYFAYFGTVDCGSVQGTISSTSDALANADSYSRLIWCLTRRPDVELRPVTTP